MVRKYLLNLINKINNTAKVMKIILGLVPKDLGSNVRMGLSTLRPQSRVQILDGTELHLQKAYLV